MPAVTVALIQAIAALTIALVIQDGARRPSIMVEAFNRRELRTKSATELLELLRDGRQHCEDCVSPEELDEIVATLDEHDKYRRASEGRASNEVVAVDDVQDTNYETSADTKGRTAKGEIEDVIPQPGSPQGAAALLEQLKFSMPVSQSPAARMALHYIFALMDTDGDGLVEKAELSRSIDWVMSLALGDNNPLLSGDLGAGLAGSGTKGEGSGLHMAAALFQEGLSLTQTMLHSMADMDVSGYVTEEELFHGTRLVFSAATELFGIDPTGKPLEASDQPSIDQSHQRHHSVDSRRLRAWLSRIAGAECANRVVREVLRHASSSGDKNPAMGGGSSTVPAVMIDWFDLVEGLIDTAVASAPAKSCIAAVHDREARANDYK